MTRFRSQAAKLACAVLFVAAGATGCSSTGIRAASVRSTGIASRAVARVTPQQAGLASGPPGACTTLDLSVSASSEQDDDGTKVARFVLADAAPVACTLTGTPGISMQGLVSAGDAEPEVNLAVSQLPVPSDLGDISQPGGSYTLRPGGATAVFYIAWFPASDVVCEYGEGFGFNAPGDADIDNSSSVDYPFGQVCDGLFYVSQVRSSS